MSRKIVIAMDGSDRSKYALQYYKDFVCKPGDDVIVVFGPERRFFSSMSFTSVDTAKLASMAVEQEGQFKDKIEKLQQIMKEVGVNGKVIRCVAGSPGEAIVKTSNDLKAELIIIGTRGQGSVRRTFVGSVSQYVVHHAEMPVLVCRDN